MREEIGWYSRVIHFNISKEQFFLNWRETGNYWSCNGLKVLLRNASIGTEFAKSSIESAVITKLV